jgi:hypothetical protein
MRRDLVVVRCGTKSLHPSWLASGADRTFDLWPCPYQDVPPSGEPPTPVAPIPGQKWSGLATFLAAERRWRDYGYVWLPDDDLEATTADIDRFFDACRGHDALLAQPALEEGSEASHLVTLRNRAFRARTTTFVEVMAPCFRRDVLERLLPTFSESATGYGWGLDDAWARILDYRGLLVFDEVTVGHHRPVGVARTPAHVRAAKAEMREVRRRHGACSMRKTTAGQTADGTWLRESDPGFLDRYVDGYRWFLDAHPEALDRLHRHQAMDPDAWIGS